ncbi:hypothetical protein CIB93_01420 [Streptomyces sp. WZ.A104]|uniref:SCO2400 family protein n=1 Tax=Streptomyces sp. WZ.A104 TaxID=2023771 RepID=UPI000BBBAC1E|nr:hypothetical protein [Streptomyces sp. WZ.A104]PCG87736.1 hypothetical protein CIB93_01420 [Streptomyces sp. WZ.A104]
MDYCHPCRRHLNGALACAGCGTPAEALGPYAVPGPTAYVPDETAAPSSAPVGRRRRTRGREHERGRESVRDTAATVWHPSDEAGHAEVAHRPADPVRGRRREERRGQRRAGSGRGSRGSHRRRGRAVLLAALGLLLAAGVLSLAELAREPGRDNTAADYVREAPGGPTEPVPEPPAIEEPRDPGPVGTRTGATGNPAAGASPTGAPDGAPAKPPSPEASRTTPPAASPDPEESGAPEPSDSPPADSPAPGEPEEPTTAPASPPPPPAEPTPAPTPSPTCTRFLWWCV